MSEMTLELKRDDACLWLHVTNGQQHGMFNLGSGLRENGHDVLAVQLLREYIDAHLAQPAQAVDATGRSAKDYAIEHAGYMARGATGLIDAINDLELAQQQFDEGGGSEDVTNAAERILGDAMGALRNLIYEFEKRRDRALSGEKAGPVSHGWSAHRENERRMWTITSPTGDVASIYDQSAGVHAEVLRQLARSLPASPAPDKEGL